MKFVRIASIVALGVLAAAAVGPSEAQQPSGEAARAAAPAKPGAVKRPAQKSTGAAKPAAGQKQCRSKLPDGSLKTWTCGTEQPCCVNHTFNLYTCGSQLLKCF